MGSIEKLCEHGVSHPDPAHKPEGEHWWLLHKCHGVDRDGNIVDYLSDGDVVSCCQREGFFNE